MTAADAVALGRQSFPDMEMAAKYADIQRSQALAPLQAQAEEMKLRNSLEVQPQISGARDAFVASVSALDPSTPGYLSARRDAISQNPYALADPIAQEVLRANDRAYDDYVQTERLRMLSEPKQLTVSQRASLEKQMTSTTARLQQATAMGDTEMAARLQEELMSLRGLMTNSMIAPEGAANTAPDSMPVAPDLSNKSEEQMWQASKQALLAAAQKEAAETGKPVVSVLRQLAEDSNFADSFFGKHVGAKGDTKAFVADRPWYAGDDVTWNDLVMALQGDPTMLQGVGTTPREARAPQGFSDLGKLREAVSPRGSWKITPIPQ